MRWPQEFSPRFAKANDEESRTINFAFVGDDVILTEANELPTTAMLGAIQAPSADFVIGEVAGSVCRALSWKMGQSLPPNLRTHNLRHLHTFLPEGFWAIAARAKQMLSWDLTSRYCGACGTSTVPADGEPAKVCPECGWRDFPRICPAVIVVVRRGEQVLLARSPHFRPGMYGALAGFMEAGESVEECLHREVREEVGIRIKNLRWFDSQTWPFPNSLMLAFHADYDGGEITPQPDEIEHAAWFSPDSLPELPYPISIAYRLISATIKDIIEGR